MNALQKANFDLLEQQFYSSKAKDSVAWVNQASEAEARQTLRHHAVAVKDPQEILFRQGMDEFLDYAGILELACLAGCLGPEPLLEKVVKVLDAEPVLFYYRDHYPLLLPQLLRMRLQKKWGVVDQDSDTATRSFHAFLTLFQVLKPGTPVNTFLALLDEYMLRNPDSDPDEPLTPAFTTLGDVVATLKDKERLSEILTRPPTTHLDFGIRGLFSFLDFSLEFQRMLLRMSSSRLLLSGCWFQCRYWFRRFQENILPTLSELASELGQPAQYGKDLATYENCLIKILDPGWGTPLLAVAPPGVHS